MPICDIAICHLVICHVDTHTNMSRRYPRQYVTSQVHAHISISMYMYIYIYHTHTYIYIYICMCMGKFCMKAKVSECARAAWPDSVPRHVT